MKIQKGQIPNPSSFPAVDQKATKRKADKEMRIRAN